MYLPALVLVVATSMLAAPLGARLAHSLPVKRLRVVFALMLYFFAVRMLFRRLVVEKCYPVIRDERIDDGAGLQVGGMPVVGVQRSSGLSKSQDQDEIDRPPAGN